MTTWPRQPDSRTCGPACVVVAQHLGRGLPPPWPHFGDDVLALHRRLNRWWPRALGTTPWAVAAALDGRVRRYRPAEVLAALPSPVPVYLGLAQWAYQPRWRRQIRRDNCLMHIFLRAALGGILPPGVNTL